MENIFLNFKKENTDQNTATISIKESKLYKEE